MPYPDPRRVANKKLNRIMVVVGVIYALIFIWGLWITISPYIKLLILSHWTNHVLLAIIITYDKTHTT